MSEEQGKYITENDLLAETKAIQKYAAIKATGEDIISVSRAYIDMTGDWMAALVLDELLFWTVPNKKRGTGLRVRRDGHLWLAVNRSEWWDRKRITERQADTAIQKLIDLGLIEKKIMLFNAKTTPHLRIIPAKFFDLYSEALGQYLEEVGEDERKEIADLYEMMGLEKPPFYKSVKPVLQNGETYVLQNGETINSPILTNSQINDNEQKPQNRTTGRAFETFQNNIQLITSISRDRIIDLVDEYTDDWFCDAVGVAVQNNARNLNYIETVLKNWKAKGKDWKPGQDKKHTPAQKQPDQPKRPKSRSLSEMR